LRRDPGGRGLAAQAPLDLSAAAQALVGAERALVLSGFRVPTSEGWRTETDGPPGALALGNALSALGTDVRYVCEPGCAEVFLALGCAPLTLVGWERGDPETPARAAAVVERWEPTHAVAIELPGRGAEGRCWSMSAKPLLAPAVDEVFLAARAAGVRTLAIGDGGNECGLATLAPLTRTLPHGDRIATTVPADYALAAGVSNWGAYVLVAALERVTKRGLLPTLEASRAHHEAIASAGAVDGISGEVGVSVDGRPWSESAALLGELGAV
jgi:hypothetical protein